MLSLRPTGSATANAVVEEAKARAEMRAVMSCIVDVSEKDEKNNPSMVRWKGMRMKRGEIEWDGMKRPVVSKIEAFYVGEKTLEKVYHIERSQRRQDRKILLIGNIPVPYRFNF
jgi:hypothetical protein